MRRVVAVLLIGLAALVSAGRSPGASAADRAPAASDGDSHAGHRARNAAHRPKRRHRAIPHRLDVSPNGLSRPGLDRCGISAVVMCPPAPH